MKRTPVGDTGLAVSAISFGTSALGNMPDTYGYEVSEERARATVHAIFDGPANMLDTSNNYGMGRSETRVGEVIRERGGIPDGFVISTKIDRDMETLRLDADRVRRSLDESLTKLGLDKVQILHLHDPEHCRDLDEITKAGGALDELFKVKEEGLADAVGLAMGRLDMMIPIVRERPFDCLINHNRYTLLNRSADELFDLAHGKGIAIFNAAPFSGGVLAKGSAAMPRVVYQEADDAALAPVRAVEEVCAANKVTVGAAALQFSMRDRRIASTIVGVSKPERVTETLEWASEEIGAAAWAAINALDYSTEDPEASRVYRPG